MVMGIIGKATKLFGKKKNTFERKGPKTIKGFKPKVGAQKDPVVEDLTTEVDISPKDIDVPSFLKKRMSPVDQGKFRRMLEKGQKGKASKFAQERTK